MGVRVYISGISGNKEVKKRQQRVCMILDSKHIPYEVIDITEPGKETDKEFMQQNSNAKDAKHPLPPQIFNDEAYCGDYDEFDLANENDELEKFLKVPASSSTVNVENGHVANGNTSSRENSAEKEGGDQQVPESDTTVHVERWLLAPGDKCLQVRIGTGKSLHCFKSVRSQTTFVRQCIICGDRSPETQPAEDSEMVVDDNEEPVKEEMEEEGNKDEEEESEEEEEE